MPAEIDHEYTRHAVCPYCGFEDRDSWELPGDDGDERESDCGNCGETFRYCRNIRVTYTTEKLKK